MISSILYNKDSKTKRLSFFISDFKPVVYRYSSSARFDSLSPVTYHRGMKVLTAAEMREVDRLTTEKYGVPGLLLMETAAARCAEVIEKKFGSLKGKRALIICGKGNNGGDG